MDGGDTEVPQLAVTTPDSLANIVVPDDELPPISPMKRQARRVATAAPEKKKWSRFHLDYEFKMSLKSLPEPWIGRGANGSDDVVAQIVFERTYQRNGESYAGMIIRVTEGVYNMQLNHFRRNQLPYSYGRAQKSAQEMAARMFHMKFLPPGRGLWAMGTPVTEERGLYASLQNCAFVTTANMPNDPAAPFDFCMDMSMLGVGVGFDTEGANVNPPMRVHQPSGHPDTPGSYDIYIIEDSRTGWVQSLKLLLNSYLLPNRRLVQFDYSEIRLEGTPLKGFGGIASGPKPLMQLHEMVRRLLQEYAAAGKNVDSRLIVDIMNMIGVCVVSGNIRRSAEIAFGAETDEDFMSLKNYDKHPERAAFGWASNNSVKVSVGADYTKIVDRILENGEPGVAWLENMKSYGRMADPKTDKDRGIAGANPCMEMGLWPFELCTLVETYPNNHDSLEDYLITLKYAFIYAKTATLEPIHRPETNRVMLKNRRIGTSMTGIAQFVAKHGLHTLKDWCSKGYAFLKFYDERVSNSFGIPVSIKLTTIKPSGTVSLLSGSTPGMHFPVAQHYLRRIRMKSSHHLVKKLAAANYHIEPAIVGRDVDGAIVYDESTVVVAVPVTLGPEVKKTESNVSMWEQLELAAFLQEHWADNQVSCTIKFDKETEGPHIKSALEYYQYRLKGISFLPKGELDDYPQLPFEPITEEQFVELSRRLLPLSSAPVQSVSLQPEIDVSTPPDELTYCDGEHCEIGSIKSNWRSK